MPRTPVALVLAGQLSDHFRSVFPLLNATLLSTPEFDVDVFVCTWNTLGSSVHTHSATHRATASRRSLSPNSRGTCTETGSWHFDWNAPA